MISGIVMAASPLAQGLKALTDALGAVVYEAEETKPPFVATGHGRVASPPMKVESGSAAM